MGRRFRVWVFACSVASASCGGSGTNVEDVVDFSGTWTLRVDFAYTPEDVFCSIVGISLTVAQDGAVLSGGSTGGTVSCSQTGTTWPDGDVEDLVLTGNARANSAVFSLEGASSSWGFSGVPRSGRFDGSFQGSTVVDAFNVGDVAIAGTWSASR